MNRFPGFNFPFSYYNPYQYHHNFYEEKKLEHPSKPCHTAPKKEETVWLDLFGIKLYFDDVLILSLLFFLYKEEVKDEGLFLALVLLLIS